MPKWTRGPEPPTSEARLVMPCSLSHGQYLKFDCDPALWHVPPGKSKRGGAMLDDEPPDNSANATRSRSYLSHCSTTGRRERVRAWRKGVRAWGLGFRA